MTRKDSWRLSTIGVVQILFVSLILSYFINEILVANTDSVPAIPVASHVKSIKVSFPNDSKDPNREDASQFHHPLYFPTINDKKKSPIVVSKGYKKYLHGFQKLVKGILSKVSKVNQSVGKFFSKFRRKKPTQVKEEVQPSSASESEESESEKQDIAFLNDHIEMDISLLKLDESQVVLLNAAYTSALANNSQLQSWADETHLILSPHLAYRYYISVDWSDNYNEHSVDKAIVETTRWRKEFGIERIDPRPMRHAVEKGLVYTSGVPDQFGRAVVYLKFGQYNNDISNSDFLKLVMYTVERADRMSVQHGSGEFVTVMDFEGFGWSKCPPISLLKEAISLMRMHYPYRLAGIYILNTSGAFNFVWNLLTPFLPRKALQKTVMIPKQEVKLVLPILIGVESLEESYGGRQKDAYADVDAYFASGYWSDK